jgi:hypothetical protein
MKPSGLKLFYSARKEDIIGISLLILPAEYLREERFIFFVDQSLERLSRAVASPVMDC